MRNDRTKTHGRFADQARVAQLTRYLWQQQPGWHALSDMQREALEQAAHVIASVLVGDPNHHEHWHRLAEFAQLAIEPPLLAAPVETAIRNALQEAAQQPSAQTNPEGRPVVLPRKAGAA